jgi:hypothetical protein
VYTSVCVALKRCSSAVILFAFYYAIEKVNMPKS